MSQENSALSSDSFRKGKIHAVNFYFFGAVHLVALVGSVGYLWFWDARPFTWALSVFLMLLTGISITVGYHRLYSHLSFKASKAVELFLLIAASATFQASAIRWASYHRRHHRHCDDPRKDPYCIKSGFFWAHMGWMLQDNTASVVELGNVKDLLKNPLVLWQDRYWKLIAPFFSFILPGLLCWAALGGFRGFVEGVLIAGFFRLIVVHNFTCFINSACHYFGSQPYSRKHTSRDNFLLAFFTIGEGYHNYHHEFQHDYRNGVRPWHFDPSKWIIWTLSKFGLTSNLRKVPEEKILLAEIREINSLLDEAREKIQEQKAEIAHAMKEAQQVLLGHMEALQTAIKQNSQVSADLLKTFRLEARKASKEFRGFFPKSSPSHA